MLVYDEQSSPARLTRQGFAPRIFPKKPHKAPLPPQLSWCPTAKISSVAMLSIFADPQRLRRHTTLTNFVCLIFQIRHQVPGYEAAAPPLALAAWDGGVALATVFSAGALFSAVAGAASALSVLAASAGLASPAGRVGSGTSRSAAVLRNALAVTVVAHIPTAALEHKGRLRNNPG